MNELLDIPYVQDKRKWYFLSIYYGREKWADLITEIMRFYEERQSQFSIYLISFANFQGEHIQATFGTSVNDYYNYTNEIESHFQLFVNHHLSVSQVKFPFGKAIWGNYPNNSISWNRFVISDFSNQHIDFHQQTINIALELLKDNFSEKNISSIGIYLIVKSLLRIERTRRKEVLSQILDNVLINSKININTIEKIMGKIDRDEIIIINETLQSYLNEDTTGYPTELVSWIDHVNSLFKSISFNEIYNFICQILSLKSSSQIFTLKMLYNVL